ncbi:beta-propeller domain-containing protein [Hyphomonas sp.]|uniref:beta-propeller domain-containing protein n=1 Tax=Hyphomonas sp. TaxID=87 RepID=UPI00391CD4C4
MRHFRKPVGLSLMALLMAGCASVEAPPGEEETGPVNRFAEFAGTEQTRDGVSPAVYEDPALDYLRSPELSRFTSEAEFRDWLIAVRKEADRRSLASRYMPWPVAESAPPTSAPPVMSGAIAGAIPAPPPPPSAPPPPPPPPPSAAPAAESVAVTGSAADSSNPEITNNQKAGVDEGGIVKQIGQHLVVLMDGRLFVTDLMPDGEAGLKLTDRANVYRSSNENTWYDEMLVSGRTILVIGYSYRESASEFTVLTLSEDGKVTREATFYISSNDYYSGSNYATRMIDGKLVIHTPIYLSSYEWQNRFAAPVIREWRREGKVRGPASDEKPSPPRPLFRAEDIWLPVQRTLSPVIHTVTVCDIAGASDSAAPACTATAMIGTEEHQFLVTRDAFWLWMTPSRGEARRRGETASSELCENGPRPGLQDIVSSALVRLPIDGATPSVLGVRGEPQDQFSMDMDAGTFRALVNWNHRACGNWLRKEGQDLAFFDTPLSALGPVLHDTAGGRYFDLPGPGVSDYEARFTENHLVYGSRAGWGTWPPQEGRTRDNSRAIVVPVDDPVSPVTLELPHDVIRAERAGPYMALTGYHDNKGLSVSLIDLRTEPNVSGHLVLEGRYESETRSHAFNSSIGAEGAGLIGLPTVPRTDQAARWWWWSSVSDMSYVAVSEAGGLALAGLIEATRKEADSVENEGYECEVSCIDWYGNARPVFTGGRILALIASELVEGVREGDEVKELRRIDLTAPLGE